jgi:hypothetical protein
MLSGPSSQSQTIDTNPASTGEPSLDTGAVCTCVRLGRRAGRKALYRGKRSKHTKSGRAIELWQGPHHPPTDHKEGSSWRREAYAESSAGATSLSPGKRSWALSVSWERSAGAFFAQVASRRGRAGIKHRRRRTWSASITFVSKSKPWNSGRSPGNRIPAQWHSGYAGGASLKLRAITRAGGGKTASQAG